jgi:hypothetical protein
MSRPLLLDGANRARDVDGDKPPSTQKLIDDAIDLEPNVLAEAVGHSDEQLFAHPEAGDVGCAEGGELIDHRQPATSHRWICERSAVVGDSVLAEEAGVFAPVSATLPSNFSFAAGW